MIVKTNPDEFENFVIDASNFKGNCEAVYFPENVDRDRFVNQRSK